jgi:hypothetical protein
MVATPALDAKEEDPPCKQLLTGMGVHLIE